MFDPVEKVPVTPPCEVMDALAVQVLTELGGRQNLHWRVNSPNGELVLRRWAQPIMEVEYELRLLDRVAALGWPVATAVGSPLEFGDYVWSLAPILPGEPTLDRKSIYEQRRRGHLMAEFHETLAGLTGFGRRGTWRRYEEILGDANLDEILSQHEQTQPEVVRILRWHLERARERVAPLSLSDGPSIMIHGDFAPWNLLYQGETLTGILDFEMARPDHRVAEFAFSWRGIYDQVVHAYAEVSPLEAEEWALITPVWWATLIECACQHIHTGSLAGGWIMEKLLVRSSLMGPDAEPYR